MVFRKLSFMGKYFLVGSIVVLMGILVPFVVFAQNTDTNTEGDAEPILEDYAEILIDFTEIAEGVPELTKNFGSSFVTSLPNEELERMNVSYDLENWDVIPRSSIRSPSTIKHSEAKKVEVTGGNGKYVKVGDSVLGIRARFPDAAFEMDVKVVPPYPVDPAVPKDTTLPRLFQGKGLITNVGVVRSAYLTIYGLNQNERVYVVTTDSEGNEYEYSFGSLDFLGWRTLEWKNPAYIEDIGARELKNLPLYPQKTSNRMFKAIKYVHSSQNNNPDLVSYVRDIKVTYDKAINDDLLNDIDNEIVWHLIRDSVLLRNKILFKRIETDMYFRYLERRKKYDYDIREIKKK